VTNFLWKGVLKIDEKSPQISMVFKEGVPVFCRLRSQFQNDIIIIVHEKESTTRESRSKRVIRANRNLEQPTEVRIFIKKSPFLQTKRVLKLNSFFQETS
jgi:hypothetical protein